MLRLQIVAIAAVLVLLAGIAQASQNAMVAKHLGSALRDSHGQLTAQGGDEDNDADDEDQPKNGQSITQTPTSDVTAEGDSDDTDVDDSDDADDGEGAD